MDGRFPIHSAPRRYSSALKLSSVSVALFPAFIAAIALVFFSSINLVYSQEREQLTPPNQVIFSSSEEIDSAKTTESSATIQIKFSSNLFDQTDNPISQFFAKLPLYFSNLKLNTIGREFHISLLYLDGLNLEKVKDIFKLFSALDLKTLEKYGLDKPAQVIDSKNIKFSIHGTKSKFLALTPNKECVRWVVGFWQFIQDYFPEVAEWHKKHGNLAALGDKVFSEEAVHMSLLQWGIKAGILLTPEQEEQVLEKAEQLFKEVLKDFERKNGKEPSLIFDIKNNSIDLVMAPSSIQNPPLPILSYKLDSQGNPDLKRIVRWKAAPVNGAKFGSIVEFEINDSGELIPNQAFDPEFENIVGEAKYLPAVSDEAFKEMLSPLVRESYTSTIDKALLSPSKKPAELFSPKIQRRGKFFLTNMHSPTLAPERAFEVLEKARALNLKSSNTTAVGIGLYASTLQEHIFNPADADLVINSITKVPSEVKTIQEAEAYATKHFETEVFSQLVDLAIQKKIAFSEMRIGSYATLGLAEDSIESREDNPYLTHQDILNGTWKDSTGKPWTRAEMIEKSKDFVKGKIDLFEYNSKGNVLDREPLSLQFLIGYLWNGEMHYLQRNGLKGVPTLMRTAVYDGADSFGIAAAISRAKEFFTIQMGGVIPRAIRDLMKSGYGHSESAKVNPPVLAEPLWVPKFAKNFLRFIFLLKQNELRLDKYVFTKVKEILIKENRWQKGYNYKKLKLDIIHTINRPEFMLLNKLRRNLNDFSEFNQRQQNFTQEQWITRKREVVELLAHLKNEILSNKQYKISRAFMESLEAFKSVFAKAKALDYSKEAPDFLKSKKNFKVFTTFEENLLLLEDTVMTQGLESVTLSAMDKVFMQTVLGYIPHLYHEYLEARSPQSNFSLQWDLIFMGFEKNAESLKYYRDTIGKATLLPRSEFAKIQQRIFKQKHLSQHTCEDELISSKKRK